MRNSLFVVIVAALAVALVVTFVGLLANWGVLSSTMVEQGKPLPLLQQLVSGVVLATVAVAIALSRRSLLGDGERLETGYVELLAVALVIQASGRPEAESNHTAIADYYEQYYDAHDAATKTEVLRKLSHAVGRAIQTKFGGAQDARMVREVLDQ